MGFKATFGKFLELFRRSSTKKTSGGVKKKEMQEHLLQEKLMW